MHKNLEYKLSKCQEQHLILVNMKVKTFKLTSDISEDDIDIILNGFCNKNKVISITSTSSTMEYYNTFLRKPEQINYIIYTILYE